MPDESRSGEARRAHHQERPAQVVPPREPDAGDVERKEHFEREMRGAGCGNGGAEAARDEIAAACTDRTDEAQGGSSLNARRLDGRKAAGVARSFALFLGLPQLFLAED